MNVRPRVLVFGCGPSGLISAYAAQREFNAEVMILSVKRESSLFGCQYLHEPISGITYPRSGKKVNYQLIGDIEEYRRKVYGSLTPPVSPQQYAGDHIAYDLRAAYGVLWEMFEPDIQDILVKSSEVKEMIEYFGADLTISSIPANVLCQQGDEHNFKSVSCWAIGDAPALGQSVPIEPRQPNSVVCNGEIGVSWYRISNVFGHSTVEWPGWRQRPPLEGVVSFSKPLVTDCDCLSPVLRVGRYGRWQKGVLSHQAYTDTAMRLREMAA